MSGKSGCIKLCRSLCSKADHSHIAARSLYSADAGQNADTIESHPNEPGLFALGTYQVDKQEDEVEGMMSEAPPITRKGILRLMRAEEGQNCSYHVKTLAEIHTPAILDTKWLRPASSLLSVAFATSSISLYRLNEQRDALTEQANVRVNDTDALCLSLDWSDRTCGHSSNEDDQNSSSASIAVSQSDGTLTHIDGFEGLRSADKPVTLESQTTWKAHDYEAWIAAFDCWSNGSMIWSGGDDLTLKGWDVRTPRSDDGQRCATFTHKGSFEGGVTAIQSHHLRQHVWAVGSYDGHVRIFDARNPRGPITSVEVGGGVWRTKWHPTQVEKLLVACMHDGFKVVRIAEDDADSEVIARFDEHKSLAYGCDWDRGRCLQSLAPQHVYSCSFYDSTMHMWACDV